MRALAGIKFRELVIVAAVAIIGIMCSLPAWCESAPKTELQSTTAKIDNVTDEDSSLLVPKGRRGGGGSRMSAPRRSAPSMRSAPRRSAPSISRSRPSAPRISSPRRSTPSRQSISRPQPQPSRISRPAQPSHRTPNVHPPRRQQPPSNLTHRTPAPPRSPGTYGRNPVSPLSPTGQGPRIGSSQHGGTNTGRFNNSSRSPQGIGGASRSNPPSGSIQRPNQGGLSNFGNRTRTGQGSAPGIGGRSTVGSHPGNISRTSPSNMGNRTGTGVGSRTQTPNSFGNAVRTASRQPAVQSQPSQLGGRNIASNRQVPTGIGGRNIAQTGSGAATQNRIGSHKPNTRTAGQTNQTGFGNRAQSGHGPGTLGKPNRNEGFGNRSGRTGDPSGSRHSNKVSNIGSEHKPHKPGDGRHEPGRGEHGPGDLRNPHQRHEHERHHGHEKHRPLQNIARNAVVGGAIVSSQIAGETNVNVEIAPPIIGPVEGGVIGGGSVIETESVPGPVVIENPVRPLPPDPVPTESRTAQPPDPITLNQRGLDEIKSNDYAAAERSFQLALDILDSAGRGQDVLAANTLENLATAYDGLGRPDDAANARYRASIIRENLRTQ